MKTFMPRVVVSGVKLNETAQKLKTEISVTLSTNDKKIMISSEDGGIMKTALGVEFLNLLVETNMRMSEEKLRKFVHDFLRFVYCE